MRNIAFLLFILLPAFFCSASLAQSPANVRFASLSLCTDQLLLLLAEPEQIVSLSYLSADPRYNWLSHQVQGIHLNRGQAEEILSLDANIILASRFSASTATALLQRLGHDVRVLEFPQDRFQIYQQMRDIARLTGNTARAEQLIQEMENEINTAITRIRNETAGTPALFYTSNGFAYGAGSLRHAMLTTLGFNNIVAEAGLGEVGRVNLEWILAAEPRFIFTEHQDENTDYLAHQMLNHPAVHKMLPEHSIIALPDQYFQCGGPLYARAFTVAVEHIRAAL